MGSSSVKVWWILLPLPLFSLRINANYIQLQRNDFEIAYVSWSDSRFDRRWKSASKSRLLLSSALFTIFHCGASSNRTKNRTGSRIAQSSCVATCSVPSIVGDIETWLGYSSPSSAPLSLSKASTRRPDQCYRFPSSNVSKSSGVSLDHERALRIFVLMNISEMF